MDEEKEQTEKEISFAKRHKAAITVNYIPPEEVTRRYEDVKPPTRVYFRLDDNLGCPGKVLVDKAGYISAKEQIDNFKRAGFNLDNFRRAMYTNEAQPDDMPIDPTTRKDFDVFEAHELAKTTDQNMERAIKQAKEDAERKAAEEMAAKNQEVTNVTQKEEPKV